jgi:hypothetical protein
MVVSFFCVPALEIVFFSALFCMPALITLSASSNYNQVQKSKDANFTYTSVDNLGMGNVEVSQYSTQNV